MAIPRNPRFGLVFAFSAAACALSGGSADARATYATFDLGFVTGLNSTNAVTGYNDTDGFIRTSDGNVTTFAVPRASSTQPMSINDGGTITGSYRKSGNPHGFVRAADGTITTFDGVTGATYTWALSINNNGQITGESGINFVHGFVRSAGGRITIFDVPGADDTNGVCINDKGTIAGDYLDGTGFIRGFLRAADGTITTFAVPGATGSTFIGSINIKGTVTGFYDNYDGAGRHGFVRTPDGTITTFDGPDCRITPTGINRKDVIAGYCQDSDSRHIHGFIRRADGTIKEFLVPTGGHRTWPRAINDSGVIAGDYNHLQHRSFGNFLRFP
jgi:hypothetical protein